MINTSVKIITITFMVIIIWVITHFVKKNKVLVKYAILWYFSSALIILLSAFPTFLRWCANLLRIELESNFIIALFIALLIFISISLTIIVSVQNEKIRNLIQEVSIIKKEENLK